MAKDALLIDALVRAVTDQAAVIKQALAEHDLAQLQLDRPAPFAPLDEQTPSWALFDACEALNVACGALSALVTPTKTRVLRHGQFMSESQSLTVAAELGVADRIVELERGAGVEAGTGVSIDDLAQAIGTTPLKLGALFADVCKLTVDADVHLALRASDRKPHSPSLLPSRRTWGLRQHTAFAWLDHARK